MSEGFGFEQSLGGHQGIFEHCGSWYVPNCRPMMYSAIIVAELHEEIRLGIPAIVKCLKDSYTDVRSAAIKALSSLADHGMCPSVAL
jgi:hypothetical protein